MKKILATLLAILTLTFAFPLNANADSPKPKNTIRTKVYTYDNFCKSWGTISYIEVY